MTIQRACSIAEMLEGYIQPSGAHVQGVGFGSKPTDIMITLETCFKLDDLFSIIYDNRIPLGYNDFSIYYSEGYNNVAAIDYGR
tara:strand:+ start:242 stop:493 length:252 start_codon:yes stop_codon:yes gene_type:complete